MATNKQRIQRALRFNARVWRKVRIIWIKGRSWLNAGLCVLTTHDSQCDRSMYKESMSLLPYLTEINECFLVISTYSINKNVYYA